MSGKRTCACCGVQYEYCVKCGKGDPNTPWKTVFCTEDCKKVFELCIDFVKKRITKFQARKELDKYNINNLENYNITIQRNINDIYKEDDYKPKQTTTKKRKR